MVNFSLINIICSCVRQKNGKFFFAKEPCSNFLDMPAFEKGKFVRVYDRQGKLDKCIL
jgi:hypothetical protein